MRKSGFLTSSYFILYPAPQKWFAIRNTVNPGVLAADVAMSYDARTQHSLAAPPAWHRSVKIDTAAPYATRWAISLAVELL